MNGAARWLAAACLLAASGVVGPSVAGESGPEFPVLGFRETTEQRAQTFERLARRSGDLRLRIVFSLPRSAERESRSDQDIPLGDLIDGARGSTDPIVLQLLLDRCRYDADAPGARCDAVDLARRWTVADTQNQVAWIEFATVLDEAGHHESADEAWRRAGLASTFRDPDLPILRVMTNALPAESDPRLRHADLAVAVGIAAAMPVHWPIDVVNGCRADARRALCAAIADNAFRDADTFVALSVARKVAATTHQPPERLASRRQSEQALLWAAAQQAVTLDLDAIRPDDHAAWVEADRLVEERIARGELAPARDLLRSMRVSEAEAARRQAVYWDDLMDRLRPR